MLNLNYNTIELNYENWSDFNIEDIKDSHFFLTINRNNVKYEFVMRINKLSDKILFFGSGANRHSETPIFNRIGWIDDFDYNIVYYNDPTAYLGTLQIGWGYGSESRHYLSEIYEIIQIYLDKLKIDRKNAFFFGSSGGGFNSIMLATLCKGSTAIAYNPQTNILKYNKNVFDGLFKTIYGEYSQKDIDDNMWRISVIEFIKMCNNTPKLFYLLNLGSENDVYSHFIPFIQEVGKIGYEENIQVISFYDKALGHKTFNKEETKDIIRSVIEGKYLYIYNNKIGKVKP